MLQYLCHIFKFSISSLFSVFSIFSGFLELLYFQGLLFFYFMNCFIFSWISVFYQYFCIFSGFLCLSYFQVLLYFLYPQVFYAFFTFMLFICFIFRILPIWCTLYTKNIYTSVILRNPTNLILNIHDNQNELFSKKSDSVNFLHLGHSSLIWNFRKVHLE